MGGAGADGEWAGPGAGRGRGQSPRLTPAMPASGYPCEAAAEVVLATLREWLEQHKDKVSPGPGRGWGPHPGQSDQPPSSPRESGCRAQGQARPFLPCFSSARAPGGGEMGVMAHSPEPL